MRFAAVLVWGIPRRYRLGHSWALPWALTLPRDTHRERHNLDQELFCACRGSESDRVKRQGWITYYACPWHHLFTCLARARSIRAKWNSCKTILSSTIQTHICECQRRRNSTNTLEMQLMERNVTYSVQGSRKMFLTVPPGFFIVLIVTKKFAERWLRNLKRAMCWSLGDFSSMVRTRFT